MADRNDVLRLAALSRLSVPGAEVDAFARDFDTIITYIGQLDELSLPEGNTKVLPIVHNAFREDGAADEAGKWTDLVVAQFSARDGNSLSVKKIISHD